jgi:rhamnosyl/mannosyltransferase
MKILQVNKLYWPHIGGVEKIVQQVAEGLNEKNDFEIEVLCCQAKGKRKIEEINKVKVWRASSFGIFWGMPISFDFFRLFKKLSEETDIIDFHHPFPLGDLAFFLFKPRVRLIVHYHSDIVRQKIFEFLFRPLIFNTLKRAEKIIVSNPNLIKSSFYLRKFQEKCVVIPFGVDLKNFERFNKNEVQKIKEKYGDFVLFVGRLNYYKGVNYLIEAMKEIEANLVIIGEGPEKKNLKFKIKNLKLENKVFFLPTLTEEKLINFYHACSLFVLPSIFKSEAFGIVLIEAMACGKPIVSTELGTGTSWVNINGQTGFVVPPRDSQALATAIKKILEDKKLAQEFSENAKKRAEKEFSLERMLKETEKVYNIN